MNKINYYATNLTEKQYKIIKNFLETKSEDTNIRCEK
jgi:hypothetical protein